VLGQTFAVMRHVGRTRMWLSSFGRPFLLLGPMACLVIAEFIYFLTPF
jgi:hypothetical protein